MKPLVPPDEVQYQACGKVDRKPLPTFPQALLLRLLWLMSSHKGDISTLEKRGHFYFGLTRLIFQNNGCTIIPQKNN